MRSRTAPATVLVLAVAALVQPTAASAAEVDWGPRQQVSQHPALGSPDVAVGPRTGTGVVWTGESAGGGTDIRFRQRTPEGAWRRVRSLGAGSEPQIGMDASGNAVVVWERTRAGMVPEVQASGVAISTCGRAYVAWADTRVRLRYAAHCAR